MMMMTMTMMTMMMTMMTTSVTSVESNLALTESPVGITKREIVGIVTAEVKSSVSKITSFLIVQIVRTMTMSSMMTIYLITATTVIPTSDCMLTKLPH